MKKLTFYFLAFFMSMMEFHNALAEKDENPIFGYLFAHMTNERYGRLFYALSEDGLNWTELNDGKAVKGDEYWGHADIVTGHDGRYYLLGNDAYEDGSHGQEITIWVSDDLINWELFKQLAPDVSPIMKGALNNRGAPKLYFDKPIKTYYLSWHTSNKRRTEENREQYWAHQRTFYVTSKDLKKFSEPKRLFTWNRPTLDVIIRREGEMLYAFVKDERVPSPFYPTGKSILMTRATSIEGPWADPFNRISPSYREAPTLIPKKDGKGYYLFYEHYTGVGYEVSSAETLAGPWYNLWNRQYSVPANARHGSMIALDEEEFMRIKAAFAK